MKSVDASNPPSFRIEKDPTNRKRKLPTSAVAIVNKAKKAQKAQKVVGFQNLHLVVKANAKIIQSVMMFDYLFFICS
jgi:hypothetical protein